MLKKNFADLSHTVRFRIRKFLATHQHVVHTALMKALAPGAASCCLRLPCLEFSLPNFIACVFFSWRKEFPLARSVTKVSFHAHRRVRTAVFACTMQCVGSRTEFWRDNATGELTIDVQLCLQRSRRLDEGW